MKNSMRQVIVFIVMIALLAALHVLLHNYTFSFVMLPVALALLGAYVLSSSAAALLLLIVASELFTAFPPGVMTAVILTPYVLRKVFAKVEAGISGVFFLLIAGTVGAQLLILTVANSVQLAWQMPLSWREIWYTVPVKPLAASLILTSLIMYSLIVIWHEMLLTAPRFPMRGPLKRI